MSKFAITILLDASTVDEVYAWVDTNDDGITSNEPRVELNQERWPVGRRRFRHDR